RLGEVALEREVVGAGRLVGKGVADEAAAGEPGELEQPHRLCHPGIDPGWVPLRGPGECATPLRGLGAGNDPVRIRGRGGGRSARAGAHDEGGSAPQPGASDEVTARQGTMARGQRAGIVDGHRVLPPLNVVTKREDTPNGKLSGTVAYGAGEVKLRGRSTRAHSAAGGDACPASAPGPARGGSAARPRRARRALAGLGSRPRWPGPTPRGRARAANG